MFKHTHLHSHMAKTFDLSENVLHQILYNDLQYNTCMLCIVSYLYHIIYVIGII